MKKTVSDQEVKRLIQQEKKKGEEADPNIGQKVGNNIILVKKLGQGAMGAVYLGADTVIKRWVAVKVLIRELFKEEVQFDYMKKLLLEEGRNLAKVQHAGIILVHGVDTDYPALIMEYIDGMTFHEYLYQDEIRIKWGVSGFRQWFLGRMLEVAEALRFAHSHGLIHKDLKPSNIMISRNEQGKWDKITIIDFGLAQDNRKIKLTDGESVIGTPSYMAPEQWSDLWEIDRRTDVFSFGIMLYEILMQNDYHGLGADIPQIMANVKNSGFLYSRVEHLPIDQRTIFELCLAYDRAQRAGGMLEVIGLLKSLQLSLKHRESEFPGTSFPKLKEEWELKPVPQAAEPVEAEPAEPEPEPAEPEPDASAKAESGSKRYEKTILGQPGVKGSMPLSVSAEDEVTSQPPEPAIDAVDEGMQDEEDDSCFENEEGNDSKKNLRIRLTMIVVSIILMGIPVMFYYKAKDNNQLVGDKDEDKTLISKAKKSNPMKPASMVRKKPVKSVKLKPKKPEPSQLGKLPSLKYTKYLFEKESSWCRKNGKHAEKFDKAPLWHAFCMRKRVVARYQKDCKNPEVAIALMDEIYAHFCFYEIVHRKNGKYAVKDVALAKECKRIKKLTYKGFTHFLNGVRIHVVNKNLLKRRSHRMQIRTAWKKAHPDPK